MRESTFAKTQEKFQEALGLLVEKLQEDKNILAAILAGSLSYDVVWEKSDIDLILISRDTKLKGSERNICLSELDVNIHAWILERSRFKKMVDSSLRGSFIHSYFSKSTLLFTKDESLKRLYEEVGKIGGRDQKSQLMATASAIVPLIAKVEKFLYIKNDPQYAFIWLSYLYAGLAKIEIFLASQIPSREVIHQALKLNPDFFQLIYTDLIDKPKTSDHIKEVLTAIDQYLEKRVKDIFQPLLTFLSSSGRIKSATEIDSWAEQEMNIEGLVSACEWLAEKEIIHQTSLPVRLTQSSLEEVEELAFYHD